MTKYKELINHFYKELVDRQFEDVTLQVGLDTDTSDTDED